MEPIRCTNEEVLVRLAYAYQLANKYDAVPNIDYDEIEEKDKALMVNFSLGDYSGMSHGEVTNEIISCILFYFGGENNETD